MLKSVVPFLLTVLGSEFRFNYKIVRNYLASKQLSTCIYIDNRQTNPVMATSTAKNKDYFQTC